MNREIWRMYGVRLGKILSHLCMAFAVSIIAGLLAIIALPLVVVFKTLIGICAVILSMGLLLLKEGFAETMFSVDSIEALEPFVKGYMTVMPWLIGAALVCAIGAIVLLLCCERKGERSAIRLAFACVILVLAIAVAIVLAAGGYI